MEKMGNVILQWAGKEYTVTPEGGLMKMLSVMQDHLTIKTAFDGMSSGCINIARYSEAYAAALKLVGCNVSSLDIYRKMTTDKAVSALVAESVVNTYLFMNLNEEGEKSEEPKKKARPSSSKKKTK